MISSAALSGRSSQARHLSNLFRKAGQLATRRRHCRFVELFAGGGAVSKALKRRGFAAIALDLGNHAAENHLTRVFRDIVAGWVRCGAVIGMWAGTPCTTWSRALRRALRSAAFPMGLPGLTAAEQARVDQGNATLALTCLFIELAIQFKLPFVLENPLSSQIWSAPRLQRLMSHRSCEVVTLHMCQYGTAWKKATRLAVWNGGTFANLARRCCPRGCLCSRSGAPHLVLQGWSPEARAPRTAAAAAYPKEFADAAAKEFDMVTEDLRSNFAASMSGI